MIPVQLAATAGITILSPMMASPARRKHAAITPSQWHPQRHHGKRGDAIEAKRIILRGVLVSPRSALAVVEHCGLSKADPGHHAAHEPMLLAERAHVSKDGPPHQAKIPVVPGLATPSSRDQR